jgi:hypothetical protein
VFVPGGGGTGVELQHVGVMLAWGVVGIVVGVWRFRWEPRH